MKKERSKPILTKRALLATPAIFWLALSTPAHAEENELAGLPEAGGEFAEAGKLSEKDLDSLRGGGININGIVIDFSYFAQLSVLNPAYNINEVNQVAIDSSNIKSGEQLNEAFSQLSIQNNLSGSVIDAVQVINVVAQGALQNAAAAQMNSRSAFAAVMAARGL